MIVGATRTPHGLYHGKLARLSAPELGSVSVRALLSVVPYAPEKINSLIMGSVLQAGQGQSPARQVALKSNLPESIHTFTVNKVCGSGMQAIVSGMQEIQTGASKAVIAGGMESMSRAPLLIKKASKKDDISEEALGDHMMLDGLEDAYQKNTPMGVFAEETAAKYQFTREAQDKFATESLEKALKAYKDRAFEPEVVPIVIQTPNGQAEVHEDENLGRATPEKIKQLKPVFSPEGTITAATASGIADGASAVFLMQKEEAEKNDVEIRAIIIATASHGHAPNEFTTAPIHATEKVLKRAGWSIDDVDLFEVNEAFAVVPMAFMKELSVKREKINVHGGACAIGHPIGSSGARVVVTLLNALERYDKKRGIATVCIGGGESLAIAIERH